MGKMEMRMVKACNDMINSNLYKEIMDKKSYAPPVSEELFVSTEGIICASSETEIVDEIYGEW